MSIAEAEQKLVSRSNNRENIAKPRKLSRITNWTLALVEKGGVTDDAKRSDLRRYQKLAARRRRLLKITKASRKANRP